MHTLPLLPSLQPDEVLLLVEMCRGWFVYFGVGFFFSYLPCLEMMVLSRAVFVWGVRSSVSPGGGSGSWGCHCWWVPVCAKPDMGGLNDLWLGLCSARWGALGGEWQWGSG